jgi:hypothetical protein
MDHLKRYQESLTDAQKDIFLHGMNFQMYITDIRREIAKCRHKGDAVTFFTMIHNNYVLDIYDFFKTHDSAIHVKYEKVPDEQGEPYVSEYTIVTFSEKD